MNCKGVTGVPDFLIRKTRWGYKWSRVGDFHDSLYAGGCPRDWADEAYEELCRRLGIQVVGWPSARCLDWFGWWFYRPERFGPAGEPWTPLRLESLLNKWEAQIRVEVAAL